MFGKVLQQDKSIGRIMSFGVSPQHSASGAFLTISRPERFLLLRFTYWHETPGAAIKLIKPVSVATVKQGSKIT